MSSDSGTDAETRAPLGHRRTILVVLVALALAAVSATSWLDDRGQAYAADALKRALVTFALARTLNGVISVAQGTEVGLQPAGVGVVLTPGEILDPVNDLVERFSGIMLMAGTSLGIQNVLLKISESRVVLGIVWACTLIAVLFALSPWRASAGGRRAVLRLILVAVFVRFAVPLLIVANQFVFEHFLAPQVGESVAQLELASEEIRALDGGEEPTDEQAGEQGLLDRFSAFMSSSVPGVDATDRIEQFRQKMAQATENIINLIVVFVLETVLFPLAFLWLLTRLARLAAGLS